MSDHHQSKAQKKRKSLPDFEACLERSVNFPWTYDDLIAAWRITYKHMDSVPAPPRERLCQSVSQNQNLYRNLLKLKPKGISQKVYREERRLAKLEARAEADREKFQSHLKKSRDKEHTDLIQAREKAEARMMADLLAEQEREEREERRRLEKHEKSRATAVKKSREKEERDLEKSRGRAERDLKKSREKKERDRARDLKKSVEHKLRQEQDRVEELLKQSRHLDKSRDKASKQQAKELSREASRLKKELADHELQHDKNNWPDSRFEREPDLVPFSEDTLRRAKSAYEDEHGSIRNRYDLEFWRYLYTHYVAELIPRWKTVDEIFDDASYVVPTPEMPWSLRQLQQTVEGDVHRATALDLWNQTGDIRRDLRTQEPEYNLNQTLQAVEDPELMSVVANHKYTTYVPWKAKKILHFLIVFLHYSEIHVSDWQNPTEEDEVFIRMTLLKHWTSNALLQHYVKNLATVPVRDLEWKEAAPLDVLLMAYTTWHAEPKEISETRIKNIWANDLLLRTYRFKSNSFRSSDTYLELLTNLIEHPSDYGIYQTGAGTLLLQKPSDINQMTLQHMPFTAFKSPSPLKWNKTELIKHVRNLMRNVEASDQRGQRGKGDASDAEDIGDDRKKNLGKLLQDLMVLVRNSAEAWSYFLNSLYRKNAEFQRHISWFAGDLQSLKYLYVTTRTRGDSREARYQRLEAMGRHKLTKELQSWAQSDLAPADRLIKTFDQDARGMLHDNVPLLADSQQYQRYLKKRWSQYLLPAVTDAPEHSNCQQRDEEVKGLQGFELRDPTSRGDLGRAFLVPDGAQYFMSADFTPASPENGKVAVHSVGSGKTCMAVRVGSVFARAGFRVVWATKTSLKNQVMKNHVTEMCNMLVQTEYDRLKWLQGEDVAKHWLKTKVPKETSFPSVTKLLAQLGMDWTNLSYRQLTNALEEPEPLNQTGRKWKEEATLASVGEFVDPLRKTLIIIDETHKMFSGELDRTELPNVQVLHDKLQASYQLSGNQRCRALFLTATPTTSSVLPLLTMLNMLHAEDVFPYNMATIDPHMRMEDGLIDHIQQVREYNRQLEVKVACEMFPTGLDICDPSGKAEVNDEEPSDSEVNAYFNAKGIIGATSFSPGDLKNNLEEFWQRAFGLISYYNISADYSRFPRTEYKPIIMPSASRFQERLMASELTSTKWVDLSALAKKIRQIAAWGVFQSAASESRHGEPLDTIILRDNKENTFFEPTLDDLKKRKALLATMIEDEQDRQPDPEDLRTLQWYQERLREAEAEYDQGAGQLARIMEEVTGDPEAAYPVKKSRSSQKSVISKRVKKAQRAMTDLSEQVTRVESSIKYFDTQKGQRIKYLEKSMKRVERRIRTATKKSRGRKHVSHNIAAFLAPVEEEALDKQEVRQLQHDMKDDSDDETVEMGEVEDEIDEEEVEEAELVEERIKGEYYTKKFWHVNDRLSAKQKSILKAKPGNPKKHYFDQPKTFDAAQFRKDMPLYSPKATKLMEVVKDLTLGDFKSNPEKSKNDRHRKLMIFCEDIHAIRAVAGALTAYGWRFGMKREWMKWTKKYYSTQTDKQVGKPLQSRGSQLTWMPSLEGGPEHDYKRFLILTRSKIGGVSGASLNERSVQVVGAKGEDATYNHPDNARGKDWRIVIIDRNFVEGIDLPSTYALLFDPVLSQSSRTQIVGRISRFCGNKDLPFIDGYGWPQTVYRFGLKFHTSGLSLTNKQQEKFEENLQHPQSPYRALIPERFMQSFPGKITGNLFSPVELQVLLDGNMETQRLKKKTLDVYSALLERVNIGALLYEPAMRNLKQSRHELDDILLEEDETEREYKEEIFAQDQSRKSRVNYNLRSQKRDLMEKWQVEDGLIFSLLQYHVTRQIRKTSWKDITKWKDPHQLNRFFHSTIKPEMRDASLITVSESLAREIMDEMFAERVKEIEARSAEREGKRQAKDERKLTLSRKRIQTSRLGVLREVKKAIMEARKEGSRMISLSQLRKDPQKVEELWRRTQQLIPDVRRLDFDLIAVDLLEKKARASRASDGVSGDRKRRAPPKNKAPRAALLETKKRLNLNKRHVKHSADLQQELVNQTHDAFPMVERQHIEEALHKWLS